MEQPKLGLVLHYTQTSGLLPGGLIVIDVRITVGTAPPVVDPNTTFITNPKIRDAIEQVGLKTTNDFGYISGYYIPKQKELVIPKFFPLSQAEGISEKFQGKGIASLIEFYTARAIQRNFPEVEKINFRTPRIRRERQLRRMGLTRKEIYNGTEFGRYYNLLRHKLHRNIWKAAGKLNRFKAMKK